jgi:hypothetical protein
VNVTDFIEFVEAELPAAACRLGLVAHAGEAAGCPPTLYPVLGDGVGCGLELLGGIETYVHGEVKRGGVGNAGTAINAAT